MKENFKMDFLTEKELKDIMMILNIMEILNMGKNKDMT